jgi:hypothetical protein
VAAFLKHCLTDHLEEGMAPQDVVLTLNVANYYGNSHLVQLCELALVAHLEDDTALLGRLQGKSGRPTYIKWVYVRAFIESLPLLIDLSPIFANLRSSTFCVALVRLGNCMLRLSIIIALV